MKKWAERFSYLSSKYQHPSHPHPGNGFANANGRLICYAQKILSQSRSHELEITVVEFRKVAEHPCISKFPPLAAFIFLTETI